MLIIKRLNWDLIIPASIFSLVLVLIGPVTFAPGSTLHIAIPTYVHVTAFFILAFLLLKSKTDKEKSDRLYNLIMLFSTLFFLTDWPYRNFGLLEGRKVSLLGAGAFLLAALFLAMLIRNLRMAAALLPALAAAVFSLRFLESLDYTLIFSDDHPTFLFRLMTLKESFPNVPSYFPLWNGGIEFRDFFASGALAIYLIFYPLIHLFDVPTIYNFVIVTLLFILPFITNYLACRMLGVERTPALLAGLISLSHSKLIYRWALSFGTLGFILASQLLPITLALTYRLAARGEKLSPVWIIISVASVSLMLLWPISILFLPPLIVFAAFDPRTLLFRRETYIVAGLILILNLPWMLTFNEVSKVDQFISGQGTIEDPPLHEPAPSLKKKAKTTSVRALLSQAGKNSYNVVQENIQSLHPAILFLGLIGVWLLKTSALRILYGASFLWLLLLATAGQTFLPSLELDRFLLVATYLLAIPAALAVIKLASNPIRGTAAALLVLGGIVSTYDLLSNKTLTRFYGKQSIVDELSSAISQHAAGGRAIFAGFTLHELSHGHLAPLVYFSRAPLIARSYKHDHWRYYDVFPASFRKDKRITEFLNLYNVTLVITHDKNWRRFFESRPEEFKIIWEQGRFKIFARPGYHANYFHSGAGDLLEQSADSVRFKLASSEAVLKFNYLPALKIDGCEIFPLPIEPPVVLLGVRNCISDRDTFEIKYSR